MNKRPLLKKANTTRFNCKPRHKKRKSIDLGLKILVKREHLQKILNDGNGTSKNKK